MKTKKRSGRDLISYLPSDIIENILKQLILRDAVRTSILSREWRYKWATLPALVLKSYSQLKVSHNQLNTVVNKILMLHQGPVKELEVEYLDLDSSHYLRQWFNLLSKDHLQKLFLSWHFGLKEYGRLPSNFYSFSQLRYLYLSRCVFRLPSSFKGPSRLVSLEFENVKIKSNKLSSLISKFPFLERVVIRHSCYTSKSKALRISASKLKKFLFLGFASSVYFLNAPLLEEVHVVLLGRSYLPLPDKVKQDNFIKSLAQLSSITKLTLDGFLKPAALDGVWQNLTFKMNHLKILGLDISSYELAQISCAICLFRSAPNLESLEFRISARDQQIMTTLVYLEQQREDNIICLSVLKKVSICWTSQKEVDLELVKLIFSFSPALETFFFPLWCERSYLLEELVTMPKASPTVEISFDDMDIESRALDVYNFD